MQTRYKVIISLLLALTQIESFLPLAQAQKLESGEITRTTRSGQRSYSTLDPENDAAKITVDQSALEDRSYKANSFGVLNQVGAHFGPILSTTQNSPESTSRGYPDIDARTRLMFGVQAEIGVWSIFYFQPEINYVQRGYSVTAGDQKNLVIVNKEIKDELKVNLNYLEFPLLAKIAPELAPQSGSIRPLLLTGPTLSFLFSKSFYSENGQSTRELENSPRGLSYPAAALFYNFGAGLEYRISNSFLAAADLRYILGLTNIETSETASTGNLWARQNAFQLAMSLQYIF